MDGSEMGSVHLLIFFKAEILFIDKENHCR